jgi:serine/threonine protein kinase
MPVLRDYLLAAGLTRCYLTLYNRLLPGVHSFASDLWAFGCVLFELYFGHTPFQPQNSRATAGGGGEESGGAMDDVRRLVQRVCSEDPFANIGTISSCFTS